jgi:hypothetical protein
METAVRDTREYAINLEARQRINHELDLVRGAIELVATGSSRRVTVSGLLFGEQLLERAQRLGAANGLEVHPLWKSGEQGCDIVVEARA